MTPQNPIQADELQIQEWNNPFVVRNFQIVYNAQSGMFGLWKRNIYLFGRFWPWFPTWKSPMLLTATDPKLLEKAIQLCTGYYVDENGNQVTP